MKNPVVRLALRAVVVFVSTILVQVQASDTWDGTLLRSAVAAGILAALEVFTPLNQTVGVGKV